MVILGQFSPVLHKNISCGYSLEMPRGGASNKHPQHMFLWRNRKNYIRIISKYSSLTLKLPITTLSSALSPACDFKRHFCKQCGLRSECSFRSSLIWVHTVCLYAKIGLISLQEYSADDINKRHFQMQFFLAF